MTFYGHDYFSFLTKHTECDSFTNQTSIKEYMSHNVEMNFFFISLFLFCYGFSPKIYSLLHVMFHKNDKISNIISYGEIGSWIVSLVHHLLIVPCGIYWILHDYNIDEKKTCDLDYAFTFQNYLWFLNCSFSYMIVDFFINCINKTYIYCFHHVIILVLMMFVSNLSGELIRFIPHFILCESSGIFFNIRWFCHRFGYKDSFLNKFSEFCFVFLFFMTRIVNLPLVTYFIYPLCSSNLVNISLFLINFLQFFWFGKIVDTLVRRKEKMNSKKL